MSKFFSKLGSRRQSSEAGSSPGGTPRASRDRAVTLPSGTSSQASTPSSERAPPPPPLPPRVQVTAARSPSPASSSISGPHVTVVPPSPSSISASVMPEANGKNKPHNDDDSDSSSGSVNEAEFGVARKRPSPLDDFGEGGEDLRTPTPGRVKAPFSDSPSTWATSPASIGNSSNGSTSARPSTAPGSANSTTSPTATSPKSPKSPAKSPKSSMDDNDATPTSPAERHARAATYNGPVDPALLVPTRNGRDADAVSMSSRRSRNLFKRPSFNQGEAPAKSTSPRRKQTGPSGGLAGAIASSGLAMANPGLTGVPLPDTWSPARKDTWKDGGKNGDPPPSPPSRKPQHRSPALYGDPALTIPRSRAGSVSNASDIGDGGFSSAVSDASSSAGGADSESEDAALLAELGADIPVTGFAVASNKRNYDFHELFPSVPEGDYLIEDYGCALQRDILIQGRLYISEHHICFHANIFGWVTDVIIPIAEIVSVEKRMTAFVIPNALLVSTRTAKYAFASFLARDTVYDVIDNIRKLERPDPDAPPTGEGHDLILTSGSPPPVGTPGAVATVQAHKPTQCACGKEGKHYTETALESVLPGTPERIYNLMFASGFMKDFQRNEQKLEDIQVSDWAPGENKSLSRNMSYIKPLNGSIGPKSTKCEIHDETVHTDWDDYVTTLTTTRTPDVPSGNVFSVKTRTCIMWASAVTSRIVVTTQVEWTGRSFIKGIIERSCIDGQKTYHADLDKAMRAYINAHKQEFLPAGLEDVVSAPDPSEPPTKDALPLNGTAISASAQVQEKYNEKQRERERNARGMQWAYDTFEGALGVAKRSTSGALDLLGDAWDQTPSTAILWFVIIALLLSNFWTIANNRKIDAEREARRTLYGESRKEMFGYDAPRTRPTHGRPVEEEWVQSAVQSFLEELAARRGTSSASTAPPAAPTSGEDMKAQIKELGAALDAVEERIKALRASLAELD
ncbi:unnamed protein product [Peniophora sp. CBMAI 1063]|nr:unnamed protein product [Peniophora sp. CBMAI 1063]